MKRTLEIVKERRLTVGELLQYDVATTSPLFDDEGLMTKSIKSDIVHELEGNLSDQDPRTPKSDESKATCYIIDTSRHAEVPELMNDVEEVDMRIIPHAMYAVKCIIVLTSDTDVFILRMFYRSELNAGGLQELR
ncbi:hypothetical protein SK128_000095, partial [Halocaridina rubra]